MGALRAYLADRYAPSSANTMLSAVRGVLRSAWRTGELDTDPYLRTVDVPRVQGSRLPAGRVLSSGEIRALFDACSTNRSPAGSRDAAAFALMFGAGLRRSEAASVQLDDYDPETGALTITGKGNRQRMVYATGGGAQALPAWLAARGTHPGALLCPVDKAGSVQPRAIRSYPNCWMLGRTSRRCSSSPGTKAPPPRHGMTGGGIG